MAKEKSKSFLTSFTPDCEYLAILYPNRTIKIWSTSNGLLLEEWKLADDNPDASFTCMECSFVGKKRRKDRATCLLALGTDDGDTMAIDVLTGERKWKFTGCHPGGVAGLSFGNKGRCLRIFGTNGTAYEINSKTGEIIRDYRTSKRSISSVAFSPDEKILAVAGARVRVLNLENEKELLKFPENLGPVQLMSISDDAKSIVTLGVGEKHLQVWKSDLSSKTVSNGPVLPMRHPPSFIECKNDSNEEGGLVVLAVSESGEAYVWDLMTISQDEVNPTKITVIAKKAETDQQNSGSVKKSRISIFAAKLHALEAKARVTALIAYGSVDIPEFHLLDIYKPGEDIVVTAADDPEFFQRRFFDWKGFINLELEVAATSKQNKKANKKRAAPDPDVATTRDMADTGNGETMDGVLVDGDLNELTMGEKLASLNLVENDNISNHEKEESSPRMKPPSADSVQVLLKQALHADDRALLLDCLYNQDEKVIANSVSQLNPSDVLKFLHSLVSMIQLRGAVLACALPWLRSLLLQHATGIMSQESSLLALNSLYQLIESRVSTFPSALELSSCLDFLYSGIVDDGVEENMAITPVIYEDKDDSDEEDISEDVMDTDEDSKEVEAFSEEFNDFRDIEGSNGMSD